MILKRLAVWSIEILCEALLLMVFLTIVWREAGQSSLMDDLLLAFWGTVFVFMVGSGFLLTTAIFGVFLRGQNPWVYPAIAAMLFIVHEQFLFTGWKSPDASHLQTQAAGACIVFACTFLGGWFLRKWMQAGSNGPEPQHRGIVPGSSGV
jgi:hypothetical protein